jgi:hypothetical protein
LYQNPSAAPPRRRQRENKLPDLTPSGSSPLLSTVFAGTPG